MRGGWEGGNEGGAGVRRETVCGVCRRWFLWTQERRGEVGALLGEVGREVGALLGEGGGRGEIGAVGKEVFWR